MPDVLLSNDDLLVLGGPAEISVDVDFGPEGERGSLTFVGDGKPDTAFLSLPAGVESLKVFDTYINTSASDDEYQFLYQYIPTEGGALNWEKIFKLSPISYSYNQTITFTAGESEDIEIDLSLFVPVDLLGMQDAADFNVQVNIPNPNPVSHGLIIDEIPVGEALILPLTINAIEYSSGTWQPLSGEKTVHIFITLKNNDDEES